MDSICLIQNKFYDFLLKLQASQTHCRASICKTADKENILQELTIHPLPGNDLSTEWGNLSITLEVVEDIQNAIEHIALYGSGHTEMIATEDEMKASIFLNRVDSACVFHNASTRWADGK